MSSINIALLDAKEVFLIVQQQTPITIVRQVFLMSLLDQCRERGIVVIR